MGTDHILHAIPESEDSQPTIQGPAAYVAAAAAVQWMLFGLIY